MDFKGFFVSECVYVEQNLYGGCWNFIRADGGTDFLFLHLAAKCRGACNGCSKLRLLFKLRLDVSLDFVNCIACFSKCRFMDNRKCLGNVGDFSLFRAFYVDSHIVARPIVF